MISNFNSNESENKKSRLTLLNQNQKGKFIKIISINY